MIKRLCIYVTYNRNDQIEEYVSGVLKTLKQCGIDIYCVCNYLHIASGLEYAAPYTQKIICRENRGYDSGAYRDAIIDLIGWDKILEYDELMLVNDSFWGMFFPLENYMNEMDSADCDFWGMTGQSAGEFQNPEYKFDAHIHSYFLAFKSKVLHSGAFREFWENFEYPATFREAVINFEIQINVWLRGYGFKGLSFMDLWNIELDRNINPYYEYPYELISKNKFPLLKKKSILLRNHGFSSMLRAVTFLKENSLYPTKWIEDSIETQFYIPEMNRTECNSLEVFYHSHSDIYIYGNGVCGKNLKVYFAYKGWHYDGVIVTNPCREDSDVMALESADIKPSTGIIISVLDRAAASDIAEHIGSRCTREQLFFISECKAIQLPV
jgi:rhamnosyltransferase